MRILHNPLLFACYSIVLQGVKVFARETCYVSGVIGTYCDDGYHCCDDNTSCCSDTLTTGAIIGIVFACIFVIAVCVVCVIIIKNKKSRSGTVISSGHQQTVTVASVTHQPQGYNQGYNQPYGQQPFGQPPVAQPPQYGMAPPPYQPQNYDPVYPPPPPVY